MALDDCNPCGCIPPNIPNDKFKHDVELILCSILDALTGGGVASSITPIADKTIAFGTVTNAYAVTGFVDANKQISNVTVDNNTDGDMSISYNGSTEWFNVAAGSSRTVDFGLRRLTVTTDLYIKYTVAPSLGSVVISGWY